MTTTTVNNMIETIADNEYCTRFAMPCTLARCEKYGIKFQTVRGSNEIFDDAVLRLVVSNEWDFTDTNDVSQSFWIEEKNGSWETVAAQSFPAKYISGMHQHPIYQTAAMENLAQEIFGEENLNQISENLKTWENARAEQNAVWETEKTSEDDE